MKLGEKKVKALAIVEAHEDKRDVVRKPGLYYYQCRHAEDDWSIPCTVEDNRVWANFWGVIATSKPIVFPDDGLLDLSVKGGELITHMQYAR